MLVPLSEVLALPAFRAADPVVLTGDSDRTAIRWVHSSEVFEMGSLLAGGELLLTTGLGLHGRTADQLAAYVDLLADAGCAAVGFELGRTFFVLPAVLVEACRRRGLCLLQFRSVVPFERMVEDFHELLLRRRVATDGGTRTVWRDLAQVAISGGGLRALLDEISRIAGVVVEFLDPEGRSVERSRIVSATGAGTCAVPVRGADGLLGTLVLSRESDPEVVEIADQAAVLIALEWGRAGSAVGRGGPVQSLLSDLAAGAAGSVAELAQRLEQLGWARGDDRMLLAAAVAVDRRSSPADVVAQLPACFPAEAGPVLVGVVQDQVVVLARSRVHTTPRRLREVLDGTVLRWSQRVGPDHELLLAAADPVVGIQDLADAVRGARDILRTARRDGRRAGVVLGRDVATQGLLLAATDPGRLAAFVTGQIGPLLDHDREHRTDLVRTLDAYLTAGLSKAVCAQQLQIRRQSLYDRLDRIERLSGVSLDDPGHRLGLALALMAWRLRTGLDPQWAPGRG